MSEKGMKFDYGKVRPSLVIDSMREAILAVSAVGTFGAEKYSDDNWKLVEEGEKRYRDAALRHLLAEGSDHESGLPHLAHAAWNLLALLQLQSTVDVKTPVSDFLRKHTAKPLESHPTCKTCGETMEGDGCRSVLQCPNFNSEVDLNKEPDSNPIYCQEATHGH